MPNNKHKNVIWGRAGDTDNIRQLVKFIMDNHTESASVAGMTNVIIKDDDYMLTLRIMDRGYMIIYAVSKGPIVEYCNYTIDRSKYGIQESNSGKD